MVCSLYIFVLHDKIYFKTTVLQGGIAKILRNGGDVYGIFQFSGLNVFWNFYRSIADVHFPEQKVISDIEKPPQNFDMYPVFWTPLKI
jgi:hypothetical protein